MTDSKVNEENAAMYRVDAESVLGYLLRELDRTGQIPQWYFEHYPKVFPQAAIELAILTVRNGELHILMLQRPENDIHWPNEWHIPGTTLYPNDKNDSMWKRLLTSELGKNLDPNTCHLAFNHVISREERERGACMHAIHVARVGRLSRELERFGTFFPIGELPEGTFRHHTILINALRSHLRK